MEKTMIAEHGTPDLLEGTRESRRALRGLGSRADQLDNYRVIGTHSEGDSEWVAYVYVDGMVAYTCGYFGTCEQAFQDAREAAQDMGLLP